MTDVTTQPVLKVADHVDALVDRLVSFCERNGYERPAHIAPDMQLTWHTVESFVRHRGRKSYVRTLTLIEAFLDEFDV